MQRTFTKIWENLSCRGEAWGIQKSGRRGFQERATPMLTRVGYRRSRGRSVHKEGSPPCVPRSFSAPFHSLDHSFSTSKPEATGSYAPSSWLAFTERLFVAAANARTCCMLGARFSLLEKSKGFCCRAYLYSGEPVSREGVERKVSEIHVRYVWISHVIKIEFLYS